MRCVFMFLKNIILNLTRCFKILIKVDAKFLVFIFISSIIIGFTPSISITLTQLLINSVQTVNTSLYKILLILCIYILFNFIVSIFSSINQYYTSLFQYKLDRNINLLILEKAGTLSLNSFEDTESYNKIQRAQNSNKVYSYCSYLITILQLSITLFSYIIILISWKWWSIFLICMISIISTLLINKVNKFRYHMLRKRTEEEREKWYYQFLLTNDIAFKEIKTYSLAQYFTNKYKLIYDKFIIQDKKYLKKLFKTNTVISLLDEICSGSIFTIIILDMYTKKILIGDAVAYINVTNNIKTAIRQLLLQFSSIYNDTLYINQLFEFLDMPSEASHSSEQTQKLQNKINDISIDNLSYKYKTQNNYALNKLSISFKKGETIAIVGQNGAGKSTLAKILAALYQDYEGSIKINGIEMKEIDKNSLRKEISILFQDFTKYELSLKENISVSDISHQTDENKLYKTIKNIKFPEHIKITQQLGTWFKNGQKLSGGEWIKIGIGRVLFKNSSLIILDEPNAALDALAEIEIFKNIKNISNDKICLIITHRISNIPFYADKVLVLDKGEIVGFDSHEILIKKCDLYQKLYEADLKILH